MLAVGGFALVGGVQRLVAFGARCVVAWAATMCVHIAMQWEKVVIFRFGKFDRMAGPGLYFTIPFIEQTALKADQRIMVTGFGAEETLTSDLVPINVDAVLFWMVWDAKKACLEVENYYNSVSLAAQTALRDAIGRASVSEVAIRRNQLDQELQEVIEERTSVWGITVMSVEIRDIVIPQELQEAMSAEAQAEREKNARMVLAEVEKDISSMLVDAANVYDENELAVRLRTMHLLYESREELRRHGGHSERLFRGLRRRRPRPRSGQSEERKIERSKPAVSRGREGRPRSAPTGCCDRLFCVARAFYRRGGPWSALEKAREASPAEVLLVPDEEAVG